MFNINDLPNACYISDMLGRAADECYNAAVTANLPSTIYKPNLHIDGNQWCALYGDNLQDGVAGFGNSPAEAYADFDKAWHERLGGANNG